MAITWTDNAHRGHDGTVLVPLDYSNGTHGQISLAIRRLPASVPARRRGVIVALNGGPGGNDGLGKDIVDKFVDSPLHEVYDIIGIDPRGWGDSAPLLAQTPLPQAPFDTRPPDSIFEVIAADAAAREEACEEYGGSARKRVTTRNVARDLDFIRTELGEERLNIVGWAYGSLVGMVYGEMFPRECEKVVLDSCVGVDWGWQEQFQNALLSLEWNLDEWASWATSTAPGNWLGCQDTADVRLALHAGATNIEAAQGSGVRTLFDGAVGRMTADRSQWEALRDVVELASAASGVDKVAAALSSETTWRPQDTKGRLRPAVLEATTSETPWSTDPHFYFEKMRHVRATCPYGFGVTRVQPWVSAFRTSEAIEPPTTFSKRQYPRGLIVQSEGDVFDPYIGGVDTARRLDHTLLTVKDSAAHEIFLLGEISAVDDIVNAYLLDEYPSMAEDLVVEATTVSG